MSHFDTRLVLTPSNLTARIAVSAILVVALIPLGATAQSKHKNRGDEWTMTQDFFACRSKSQFEASNDAIARYKDGKVLASYMLAGQCRVIDSGTTVVMVESDVSANRIKVRQPGREGTWWTAPSSSR